MIDQALVKAHLRFELPDEDVLIQGYTDAAVSAFEAWTNRKLLAADADLPDPIGNAIKITKSIEQGALMLIAYWHETRQSVVTGAIATELPMSTQALWKPHRWNHF